MLRTHVVVVRRTTRVSAPSNSTASAVSETATVRVCPAWLSPRVIFCPQTTVTPVAEPRRCTRTGGGRGPGRPGATQPGHLAERAGWASAQQHPGGGLCRSRKGLSEASPDIQVTPHTSPRRRGGRAVAWAD